MLAPLQLPESEKETLECCFHNHPKFHVRNRVQAILLRSKGVNIESLAIIFNTRRHTIYEWLKRYRANGFIGLMIVPGRGLKSKMNGLKVSEIATIKTEIEDNPQSLRDVAAQLSKEFGFEISKLMLKKYLKKN